MKTDDPERAEDYRTYRGDSILHMVLTNAEGLVADLSSSKPCQPFFLDLTRKQHAKCRAELVRLQELLARVLRQRR